MILGHTLDGNDPLGRGGNRIVAKMHGRGARMIGAAQKFELHPCLSHDGFHCTKRPSERFEDRSLLDVKFQVGKRVVAERCARNILGIQSEVFDGGANGNSIRVLAIQEIFVEPADKRAAADKWCAEADSFLFGKADDFDGEGKAPTIERFEESDGDNNSENAVIGSGVGNRVEMRAEQQAGRRGLHSAIEGAQIPSGVDRHFGARGFEPLGDFAVTIVHRPGEESAARAGCVFRERRQFSAASDHFFRANCCASDCGHESSTLPAKARFDGAVGLFDRHKNLVGIVLAEAREVREKKVFVGHRQLDISDFRNIRESAFTHGV